MLSELTAHKDQLKHVLELRFPFSRLDTRLKRSRSIVDVEAVDEIQAPVGLGKHFTPVAGLLGSVRGLDLEDKAGCCHDVTNGWHVFR